MTRWIDGACGAIEAVIASFLAAMVVLVFGNVVLRYGFNAGIAVSEEVSRWLFIWITFLGAVVALKEHSHLGVDTLVSRLPRGGRKLCLALTHLLMLYVLWLLFQGSLAQARINWDVQAPVTGAPMAIVYAAGIVFAVCAGFLLALELLRLATGRLSDMQLVTVQESEEAAALSEVLGAHAPPSASPVPPAGAPAGPGGRP